MFKLLFSRKYGQKIDRERSEQLLPLPSPRQVGENKQSLFFIVSVPILGRRFGQGIPARSIPLASSILHLLHSTWHLSILPTPLPPLFSRAHLLKIVFLNFTPSSAEFTRILRHAPSTAGTQPTEQHRPSAACAEQAGSRQAALLTALLRTTVRLYNNPVTSVFPTAERGRLCIKGSVLKREEYFPMRNQHPHKTKS